VGSFIKKSQFYFIASFALGIAVGALLLMMPFVRADGGSLTWVDALFTATSAICVTGLATVPISEFSLAGQLIVLFLVQIGGLGIITLSVSIVLFLGRNMSWSNTRMLSNITEQMDFTPEVMVRGILYFTLVTEGAGVLLLLPGFYLQGLGFFKSLYYAIYFSVSAFCNAGMSPTDGSLVGMSAYLKLTVAALITAGGLGIYAVYDLSRHFRQHQQLRVNTKLILYTSSILIVLGTVLILIQEYAAGHAIKVVDAIFLSISARTAGFNSVPMQSLSNGSCAQIGFLMLIGGAPGSTAGGIKTTTCALVAVSLINAWKGNQKVLLFHREIPISNILKAFTISVMFFIMGVFGASLLLSFMPHLPMQHAVFEITSALGTVGLSLGVTTQLELHAKLLLIFYMFLGRVGPFTVFLFLLGRERSSKLSYPQENIIIG